MSATKHNPTLLPAPAARVARAVGSNLVFVLVPALFVVTGLSISGFFTWISLKALLVLASLLGVASVGQTITIALGGIDLSIPGFIAFSGVMAPMLYGEGWPFWTVALLVVAVGAVVGALNGFLSAKLQAPSLIVTLATGSAVTGLALYLSEGSAGGQVPLWLVNFVSAGAKTFGVGVPPVVVAWLALGLASYFLQRRATLARRIYAAGASPGAARVALVPVVGLWAIGFAISGVFAALTGLLLAGFSGGIDASAGTPYLFLTIAAVVVGGNSLLGGHASYLRTMAGAFLITNLTTLLVGVGVGPNTEQVLLGALILAVVVLYGRESHVSARI